MKKYLAIDSGGTKVLALLYDENFRIIRVCRAGSLRENTTPKDLIADNVESIINGLDLDCTEAIDHITGITDRILYNRITESCTVGTTSFCGELELGLSAACLFGDALLALSGTGATLFSRYNGSIDSAGGYGAAVSDAGSGYWIGRHAMEAATAYDEGRGESTLLKDMITERFGRRNLREAIFSIYSRRDISPSASVASCAPLVTEAAYRGDETAHEIIIKAGRVLGKQLLYLIRKHDIHEQIPVTVSGSVWRGHHDLFGEFSRVVHSHGAGREIIIPEFEPIVGAVIHHYRKTNGSFGEKDLQFFRKEYAQFGFSVNTK